MVLNLIEQSESLLSTVVRIFALDGSAKEVAILANSKADIKQTGCNGWNQEIDLFTLYLNVSLNLYYQIEEEKNIIEESIKDKINSLIPQYNQYFESVSISPEFTNDKDWREKANNWLKGDTISNQGRVRSDNIASKSCDGLLFRSQPEIYFYKALKSLGISFAPLAVFIRGGHTYHRIEPDFIIVKDGIMCVVEIDGDTVHNETPAEAHSRTTMLLHEGVHFERINASECNTETKALKSAKNIIDIINKIKNTK